jgi:hypothetical protein
MFADVVITVRHEMATGATPTVSVVGAADAALAHERVHLIKEHDRRRCGTSSSKCCSARV